jgi:hypothetical protein
MEVQDAQEEIFQSLRKTLDNIFRNACLRKTPIIGIELPDAMNDIYRFKISLELLIRFPHTLEKKIISKYGIFWIKAEAPGSNKIYRLNLTRKIPYFDGE